MTRSGNTYYSGDGESEYTVRHTHSGYAIVRGDGDYAEFASSDEAHDAAEALATGQAVDGDYYWTR